MRIRKNAKLSELLNTSPNLSRNVDECELQKNLCQLNQSPWDIITFPSSDSSASSFFHQFDDYEVCYNVNLAKNGNSIESTGDFERLIAVTDSVNNSKTSSELGEKDNFNGKNSEKINDFGEILLGFKDEVKKNDEFQEEVKLCGERDEKGWQCGRSVATYGNTMCCYHLSKLQNDAVWTTKKKPGPVSGLKTGTRWKKRPTKSPNDYYYYSGFGPSWAKKRGESGTVSNGCNEVANNSIDCDMDVKKETGKRIKPEISEVGPMELSYIDDEDEDEDENGKVGIVGKKRGRKPIKEKSLKSLMR